MIESLVTDSGRLSRAGLVLLGGLWWVSAGPGVLATPAWAGSTAAVVATSGASCYNQNGVCERSQGEDCASCSEDCDCICGDDICSGTSNETCSSCPEDCWDECVCGDSQCITPAEYGGYGSFNEPECNPSDPWAECSYCPTDCGQCSGAACDPYVCEDEYGQCRDCEDDGECYWGDQYCEWYGQCEHAPSCESWWDCYNEFGFGWECGPGGYCVRVI